MLDTNSENILSFAKQLVATPSYEFERGVADLVYHKLESWGFAPKYISPDLEHPSIICQIDKPGATKRIWFESPLDTAPPGNVLNWKHHPLHPVEEDGRVYGLGIADAKIAISMYLHLVRDLYQDPEFEGSFFLGFDSQEQNGKFMGIRDIMSFVPRCDACVLGYQSFDEIHIGARGWMRLKLTTQGQAAHTGSRSHKGINAIHHMNKLLTSIQQIALFNQPSDHPYFPFGSRMNISMLKGGEAINTVPDRCEAWLDIRLSPHLSHQQIIEEIENCIYKLTEELPNFECLLEITQGEEAYLTDDRDQFVRILQKQASQVLQQDMPLVASGPGSVGNVIAPAFKIPIINAFGVRSNGVHAADEWIEVSTIQPVYQVWRNTLIEYCAK